MSETNETEEQVSEDDWAAAMGEQATVESANAAEAQPAAIFEEFSASGEKSAMPQGFDMILDTVSADHSLDAYMQLLKVDGSLVMVGVPPKPQQVSAFSLIMPRRNLSGSLIGGIAETQEMLDWCGAHGVDCDIELIPIQRINEAWDRVLRADVKYRFVIDMWSMRW